MANQQAILDAFSGWTYVPDRMDVQHTPVYDQVILAAAATINDLTSAFFTNVGPASNKTLGQTNMTQQQKLPAPEAFSIFGIRLWLRSDILRLDLETILNQFAFELVKGQKVYQRAPLWYFSSGAGIDGFTTRNAESCYTNGSPHRESMHKLALNIVLENQETFSGNFRGTAFVLTAAAAGGTGLTAMCLLDGLYARGVQ